MLPNKSSCNTSADYGVVDSFIGANSFHPGGTNLLLMDGSVRFVKDGIGLAIWSALGTRAGGEVLSADAL
jgi:prepilin-type processing-associated H-X9-DG protein